MELTILGRSMERKCGVCNAGREYEDGICIEGTWRGAYICCEGSHYNRCLLQKMCYMN